MLVALHCAWALAEATHFFQPQVVGYFSPDSVVSQPITVPMIRFAANELSLQAEEPVLFQSDAGAEYVAKKSIPNAVPFAVCALAIAGMAMRKPISRQRSFATMSAVHGLSAKALSGRKVDFASFKGKPLLIVNVASL